MVVPNRLLAMGPTIFELWIMKIDDPNTPLVTKHNKPTKIKSHI